jgi:hypothetical protein
MELSRRRLLRLLGTLAAIVGAPIVALRYWRRPETPTAPARPARNRGPQPEFFPYLKFAAGVVEAFEADYRRYVGQLPERARWPNQVRGQFLLSTDFFRFNADESRVIEYVGFYEPSVTPCNNPLARLNS